jgi:hypothetical protein
VRGSAAGTPPVALSTHVGSRPRSATKRLPTLTLSMPPFDPRTRAESKVNAMPTPPSRHKEPATFTPDEHLRSMRGETILSDEYVAYRSDALHAAGLDDEVIDEPGDKALADLTPDEHLAEIRRGRR